MVSGATQGNLFHIDHTATIRVNRPGSLTQRSWLRFDFWALFIFLDPWS